jgi:hypothetical protein
MLDVLWAVFQLYLIQDENMLNNIKKNYIEMREGMC